MSVAKWGRDDGNCGASNGDILHAAICRLVKDGVTVVVAAANDSGDAALRVPGSYDEVITVSALADTDGRPGGLGGHRCFSWGTYDRDDTFADFSNYGSDVDLIAPGKCILSTKPGPTYGYSSGTSMAAPHVTGAVALYKASRPLATPAEVRESLRYLGNLNWYTRTDPDPYHEPLLNVSRIGTLGTFRLAADTAATVSSRGGTVLAPFNVFRSSTFFERVRLSVSGVPSGWTASLPATSLYGWTATSASVRLTAPRDVKPGTYHVTVTGTNWGRSDSTTLSINVAADVPTAKVPVTTLLKSSTLGRTSTGATTVTMRATWAAATDPSDTIVRYEAERSVNGGAFGWTVVTSAATRSATFSGLALSAAHRFRVRAQDSDGTWSAWATASASLTPTATSDRSSLITYRGTWIRYANASSTDGWVTSSSRAGASARFRFTGRTVAVVALANAARGKASIYIDGKYHATIDTYASTTTYRKIVYVGNWAVAGTHTIEVRVAATAGRPTVSLDGFLVLR